jgi:hypothetical protein
VILDAAEVALYVALASTSALLLLYGFLQPWWRSWFGTALVLTLFAVWQMLSRALVTEHYGTDYPGRDLVLLVGRTEIAIAMTVSAIYLGRLLIRDVRGRWAPDEPPVGPEREHEYH